MKSSTQTFAGGIAALCVTLAFASVTLTAPATAYGRAPLIITDTPRPLPTNTPVPNSTPAPAPVPGDTRLADPYVQMQGCTACVPPGELSTFTVVIGNRGQTDAVNVTVANAVPSDVQIVSVEPSRGTTSPGSGPNQVILTLGTVRPDELITVRFTIRMPVNGTGNLPVASQLYTSSTGQDPRNDGAVLQCGVCAIVLPVTGDEAGSSNLYGVLSLVLIAGGLITLFAALRMKTE
jgi:uncharacterized repeat protein (TIGR01451 family)